MTQKRVMAPDGRMVKPDKVRLHDKSKHTLTERDIALCGTAGELWCDTCSPAPAGRCPFEYDDDHAAPFTAGPSDIVSSWPANSAQRLNLEILGDEPEVYFSTRGTVAVWLKDRATASTPREIRLEMSLDEASRLVVAFSKFGVFA